MEQSTSATSDDKSEDFDEEGTELLDCDGSEVDSEEQSDPLDIKDEESEEEEEELDTEDNEIEIVDMDTEENEEDEFADKKYFKVVQEYQDLLNKHRAEMSTQEAVPLLPFFNSVQLHISSARSKLKKERSMDKAMTDHLISTLNVSTWYVKIEVKCICLD